MTSTQDRVLAAVTEAAEAAGLEVTLDKEWANTGRLHAFREGSLEAVFGMAFDFQPRYALFHVVDGPLPVRIPSRGGGGVQRYYVPLEKMQGVVDEIAGRLRKPAGV